MSYRKNATGFVWDILKSDFKLLAYPICSIVAMLVLLIGMSPLIFDMSAIHVADNIIGVSNDALQFGTDISRTEPFCRAAEFARRYRCNNGD